MDETKTSAGSDGKSSSSSVPEGSALHQGQSAGYAPGAGVQALPVQPGGPGSVEKPNFDLLAVLGEAEQFAISVKNFADLIPDPRWQAISKGMDAIIAIHDQINATPQR